MSHGIIHTRKHGLVHGIRHFSHPLGSTTWTLDATSGKALPQTAGELNALITASTATIGGAASLYRCQDPNTSLADAIGTFTMAQAGAGHLYQQAVTGWAAKAVQLTEATVGSWLNTDAGLPDVSTASQAWVLLVEMPALPGNTRNLVLSGVSPNFGGARFNITTGFQSALSVGTVQNGATNLATRVMPIVVVLNRTAGTLRVFNDVEALPSVWDAAMTGKSARIGSTAQASAAKYFWIARWDGAAAETLTQANVKLLLQTMGWTIPW